MRFAAQKKPAARAAGFEERFLLGPQSLDRLMSAASQAEQAGKTKTGQNNRRRLRHHGGRRHRGPSAAEANFVEAARNCSPTLACRDRRGIAGERPNCTYSRDIKGVGREICISGGSLSGNICWVDPKCHDLICMWSESWHFGPRIPIDSADDQVGDARCPSAIGVVACDEPGGIDRCSSATQWFRW